MAAVIPTMGATFRCITSLSGVIGFFASFSVNKNMAYAVTCSHGLGSSYSGAVARPSADLTNQCAVYLPANALASDHVVGYRVWASVLTVNAPVEYDCAIARLSVSPSSSIGASFINKYWIDTDLPSDIFLVFDERTIPGKVSTQISSPQSLSVPGRDGTFTYRNLYGADYSQPGQVQPPIAEGMSGAPIITADGFLVGMHIAGDGSNGFFHRADDILRWTGMDLYQV